MRTSLAIALSVALAGHGSAQHSAISVDWELKDGGGGISGLHVSADGESFTAISDTGVLYSGRFQRDAAGRLAGVESSHAVPLKLENGTGQGRKKDRDTEAIAVALDGTRFISIERRHRILQYEPDRDIPKTVAIPANSLKKRNGGFEALAIDSGGALYLLPEASHSIRTPYPIFKQNPSTFDWTIIGHLPRHGGFRPVGADFGPDGSLYVLSRAFSGFAFASRIDRIDALGTPDQFVTGIFSSDYGDHDNLEGIAAWRDDAGRMRLTLVSDDNFSRVQRTHFVELTIE